MTGKFCFLFVIKSVSQFLEQLRMDEQIVEIFSSFNRSVMRLTFDLIRQNVKKKP